jgi:hypothetical protein
LAAASDDEVQAAALFGRAGCIKRQAYKRARLFHEDEVAAEEKKQWK